MIELHFVSIADLRSMIAGKVVSPVEVVRAHLERIEARDRELRSFITVCADHALEAAKAAEARVMAGEPLGPLHGVPIGLKDLCDTAGIRTTGGSKIFADRVPAADATVTRRLEESGAIVIGKLNMHEFAYGPVGLNDHYGHARNPWDAGAHRVAGGSSSGSGVAVAAGLCAGATGSDTGGSIRIPASLCGITGIKPTYGRVSRAGVLPLAWTMDHVGPMARSAVDCALMLGPMAGYDPADATTSVLPVPDYTAALTGDIKGLRIGLLRRWFLDSSVPEVAAGVEAAVKMLESLGAKVDEVTLEHIDIASAASYAIVAAEALAYHSAWLRTRAADYQEDVRARLTLGVLVTGEDYVRAQQVRAQARDEVDEALRHRDVLIAPATPIVATRVDETEVALPGGRSDVRSALIRLTRPFNFSGHPACSLPCGFTIDRRGGTDPVPPTPIDHRGGTDPVPPTPPGGLPIGMQIVGRPFDEATVLRAADAYQRATDWHARRPPLA